MPGSRARPIGVEDKLRGNDTDKFKADGILIFGADCGEGEAFGLGG